MFIDTHNKDSMIKSMCSVLNISQSLLKDKLLVIDNNAEDKYMYDKLLDELVDEWLSCPPDEILFFHLSRRLFGTEDDVEGRNLANLLTTKNAFTEFLNSENIQFIKNENHIDVLYNNQIINWDNCKNGNKNYMKSRLGYFVGREDYCFNGFAFKDLLFKNEYAKTLSSLPEFLSELIKCIGCNEIREDFISHSDFYCYEYKIPLNLVIFDNDEKLTYGQKQKYLIRTTLFRIICYLTSDIEYMNDFDNLALRLEDDYILPTEYFVSHEKLHQ